MKILTKKFFESMYEKNKELICKYANELKERLGYEKVMDTMIKIFEYKEDVNRNVMVRRQIFITILDDVWQDYIFIEK